MGSYAVENALPKLSRYITTHDTNGNAIVSNAIPPTAQWQHFGHNASFFLGYCTTSFPVDLSCPKSISADPEAIPVDIAAYSSYLSSPPGLVISGGTVMRVVDMRPDHTSPMHRTLSLDYGVVIEGEVELVLDSGETRLMRRGDMAVQRATAHAWRNTSKTEWARMLFVLIPSQAMEVKGNMLGEDLGGMEGVKDSPTSSLAQSYRKSTILDDSELDSEFENKALLDLAIGLPSRNTELGSQLGLAIAIALFAIDCHFAGTITQNAMVVEQPASIASDAASSGIRSIISYAITTVAHLHYRAPPLADFTRFLLGSLA